MNRLLLLLLVVAAPLAALTPVAARAPAFHKPSTSTSTSTTTSSTSNAHQPLRRIVSLSPMVTETLFALGIGPRVVGVTRYCDRPAAATSLPKVGGYGDASLEAVLALKPALVIAQYGQGQWPVLDRLREHHVEVFIIANDTLAESQQAVAALAAFAADPVEAAAKAQAIIGGQRQALAAAAGSAVGVRAVVVVGTHPLVIAGAGSFADTALRATGATSSVAPGEPAWPIWSLETILARSVDVVVVADGSGGTDAIKQLLAPLQRRAPRVVAADHAILMRSGPGFADDVATLAALLRRPTP